MKKTFQTQNTPPKHTKKVGIKIPYGLFFGISPRVIEPQSLDMKSNVLLTTLQGQRNFGTKNFCK